MANKNKKQTLPKILSGNKSILQEMLEELEALEKKNKGQKRTKKIKRKSKKVPYRKLSILSKC